MERTVIRDRPLPDYAESIIGPAGGRTGWLHPGYGTGREVKNAGAEIEGVYRASPLGRNHAARDPRFAIHLWLRGDRHVPRRRCRGGIRHHRRFGPAPDRDGVFGFLRPLSFAPSPPLYLYAFL